jgi:hypothetical protein
MNNTDLEIIKDRLEHAASIIEALRKVTLPVGDNSLTALLQVYIESSLYRLEKSFPTPEDVA